MENDYTIAESYELPSKGLVYNKHINPTIKLRSMTTEEEMKRLGHSERPNELLAEIIDDCLINNKEIKSYDLCVADFQYLLYKLRIVTYGPKYKISTICPVCGRKIEYEVNLEDLETIEYNEEMQSHLEIKLPTSGKIVKIKMQTPRILDEIKLKSNSILEKSPNIKSEPAFLYNIISMIDTIDGQVIDDVKLEQFIRKMPMKDTNSILNNIRKLNFGIQSKVSLKCTNCKASFDISLPITGEFFGPTED